MAIVDKIKNNITASGGDASGIRNIEDAVARMSSGVTVISISVDLENRIVTLLKKPAEIVAALEKGPVYMSSDNPSSNVIVRCLFLSYEVSPSGESLEYHFNIFKSDGSGSVVIAVSHNPDEYPTFSLGD